MFLHFEKEPYPKAGIFVLNYKDVWLATSLNSQNDHFTKRAGLALCCFVVLKPIHLRAAQKANIDSFRIYITILVIMVCRPFY